MKFRCPYLKKNSRTVWDVLLWKFGYYHEKKLPALDSSFAYPLPEVPFDPNRPWACFINHSSYLISHEGINVLTDPIWSERCSPFSFIGPKRYNDPPLALEALPPIHYVLISHDHYDHLDEMTVKKLSQLNPDCQWIVPKKLQAWFHKRKIFKVKELFWWETYQDSQLIITAVPAQHHSGRGFFDRNKSLWCGYVCQFSSSKKIVYFVGDTGYNPYDFKTVGVHFGVMDLSLIPIGCYLPTGFMAGVHVSPKEAVCIHQEVHSKLSLAMHWNTFRLSDEPEKRPPYDLYQAMKEAGLNPLHFLPIPFGLKINW